MNVQEIKKAPRPRYSGILVHPTSFPSPYGIGISVIVPMPLSTFYMTPDRPCGSVCR